MKDNTKPDLNKNPVSNLAIPITRKIEAESLPSGLPIDIPFRLDKENALKSSSFPNPPRNGSSQTPTTIPNLKFMLDAYGIRVSYDVIRKRLVVNIPGVKATHDNFDNVALTEIMSLAILNGMQMTPIPNYIEALGDRNHVNPVKEWIQSKPWDRIDRLIPLYATLSEQEDYPKTLKEKLIYRWLLSATAAALKPEGFKGRGVLTLQGPQGLGKTTWITSLINDPNLRDTAIKIDHHLDASNKDTIISAVSHWLVEIGELDSSFKKDIARLKGFLTSDKDKVRRPYARNDSEYPRRTVFCATVNDSNFLVDLTGNSRWWTVALKGINFKHKIDMQQVFAQLKEDFEGGQQWWLTPEEEELLDKCNSKHLSINVVRERLDEYLGSFTIDPLNTKAMTPIQVLKMLSFENYGTQLCKDCAAILREKFGEPKKNKLGTVYRVPQAPDTTYNFGNQYES